MHTKLAAAAVISLVFVTLSQVTAQDAAATAYAPVLQPCPAGTQLVREVGSNASAQTLSANESQYVSARQSKVLPSAWTTYLGNVKNVSGDALPSYVSEILTGQRGQGSLPTLGIATSGGGYRAAIFGAGTMNALDGRNSTSVRAGTGGLLQSATYLAGLSGGSWLVTSLSQADFPMLPELAFGPPNTSGSINSFGGWLTQIGLVGAGNNTVQTAQYFNDLIQEVGVKGDRGFPVTVTDVWARALSRHFVNGTTVENFFDGDLTHGAGITFSSIANVSTFVNNSQPFPIVIADSLTGTVNTSNTTQGTNIVPLNNPIFEFNVFEMGSFDTELGAFTPTRLLGSPNSSICATGYDQASFIEGVSSSLFNGVNSSEDTTSSELISFATNVINVLRGTSTQSEVRLDVAQIPNPFLGVANTTFPESDQRILTLVDGGENGETTPFQPLLVKARGVDTIIAIDAPADTSNRFANGSSLISTQNRVKLFSSAYSFPSVPPDVNTYLSLNLTRQATFFGCNSSASSHDPLLIYIANGGPPLGQTPVTNTSTFQLQYPKDEVQSMFNQVFDIATQGIPTNGKKDPQWPACLACAVVDRARRNASIERSGVCATCLQKYCWS